MKKLLMLVFVLFLAGCVTQPVVRIVQSEKMVLLEPEQKYLADCQATEPPTVQEYMAMGVDQREDILTRRLTEEYKHRQECTLDKRSLRDLLVKQRAIVAEYNAKEEARVQALKLQLEKNP